MTKTFINTALAAVAALTMLPAIASAQTTGPARKPPVAERSAKPATPAKPQAAKPGQGKRHEHAGPRRSPARPRRRPRPSRSPRRQQQGARPRSRLRRRKTAGKDGFPGTLGPLVLEFQTQCLGRTGRVSRLPPNPGAPWRPSRASAKPRACPSRSSFPATSPAAASAARRRRPPWRRSRSTPWWFPLCCSVATPDGARPAGPPSPSKLSKAC